VHFLRFELTESMIQDLHKDHTALIMGVDHPAYQEHITVNSDTTAALIQDFDILQ